MVESWEINGFTLEYIDDTHTYLVDGIIVPSITQLIKMKFNNKYDAVPKEVLKKAADKGTAMHLAIELYEKENKESDLVELKNYKFLKKHLKWNVIASEIPIILFYNDKPIAAGRLDQVIEMNGKKGINDLKRTASFDKEYVALQTNLYRIGYKQSYGTEIDFVSGLHLRDNTRKFYKLPVNEEYAIGIIEKYLEKRKENE
ncbi:MAG: hypothetical protein MSA15_16570 [Clostridium sp.]|nr:hypothetical protein [Clostridium sp.]